MNDLFDTTLFEELGNAQTLSLIHRETTQSLNGDTGTTEKSTTETTAWSGTGILQPNSGGRPAIGGSVGGAEETLVPYRAFLPWDAHPRPGWILRNAAGEEFEMVTDPLDPGGANAYWLLNLGHPTRSPDLAYISTGLWVEV